MYTYSYKYTNISILFISMCLTVLTLFAGYIYNLFNALKNNKTKQ